MTNPHSRLTRGVIELLAPARDAECARAAIDHGADAIYIGAPLFGARKAASNSLDDIAAVVDYAHLFGCRVHVALNTLLFDDEVRSAREMAWSLYHAGVDVLIVQDAALLRADAMPPIELHASTQCDNRTAAKVRFWQELGLRQVVLARELSLDEITDIACQTSVRLEAFVHGALCVSYSGQCYLSHARGGRSANRGECAQPCRLAYDVISRDGQTLMRHAYPLSLRDNNQSANIEALINAGVSSFKIEGRLKDAAYVANVTLYYRQLIDEVLARRPDLSRLSRGTVIPGFEANPAKSFNRGFTDYFAHGRSSDIWQPLTPKSLGEPIGRVTKVGPGETLTIDTRLDLANGDGLCFTGRKPSHFCGTKVNTVRTGKGGVVADVQSTRGIMVGDAVSRNSDMAFAAALGHDSTRRSVAVDLHLDYSDGRLTLSVSDADGACSSASCPIEPDRARNVEMAREQMKRALVKTGGTAFDAASVEIDPSAAELFVAASVLNALRRDALDAHAQARRDFFHPEDVVRIESPNLQWPVAELGRSANVINSEARAFYEAHGATMAEWGYERQADSRGQRLMTTRHCIMNALGKCLRKHPECANLVPLTLRDADGRTYEARFNCGACQMEIY